MIAIPPIARLTLRSESSTMRKLASSVLSCSTTRHRRFTAGDLLSIGDDCGREVAARLTRVNNSGLLYGNVREQHLRMLRRRLFPLANKGIRRLTGFRDESNIYSIDWPGGLEQWAAWLGGDGAGAIR